jgi:hypothetical protein
MIYFEQVLNTLFLLVVMLSCFLHLAGNVDKHSSHCERFGFAFTSAGAFGLAIYPWVPWSENFPFDTLMHSGMALIAASLVQGKARAFLASLPGLRWTDRRRHRAQS